MAAALRRAPTRHRCPLLLPHTHSFTTSLPHTHIICLSHPPPLPPSAPLTLRPTPLALLPPPPQTARRGFPLRPGSGRAALVGRRGGRWVISPYLHTSPHISTHLPTSPHISTHLHTSPHISTHLHTSPHRPQFMPCPFAAHSERLRPCLHSPPRPPPRITCQSYGRSSTSSRRATSTRCSHSSPSMATPHRVPHSSMRSKWHSDRALPASLRISAMITPPTPLVAPPPPPISPWPRAPAHPPSPALTWLSPAVASPSPALASPSPALASPSPALASPSPALAWP